MFSLFKKDNTGKIRQWTIEPCADSLIIRHGYMGGSLVNKIVPVKVNQSGRSIDQQIELEMNSRITKQMDKGYSCSLDEANNKTMTNALDLPLPMLAQPVSKINGPATAHYCQYKYDGMRCLIHNDGSRLIAYSRGGKPIETITHIKKLIDIPVGATVDGELYMHGTPLQTIMSTAKRFQPGTLELKYVVYDHVCDEPYSVRLANLKSWIKESHEIFIAPTKILGGEISYKEDLDLAQSLGYEGLILRHPHTKYEAGKRSKSLNKMKTVEDDEFVIVDIYPSKE